MDETPRQILHRIFGYDRFRGAQAEIIEQVMKGGDALVLMPTGGGKSLCYQIPALLRPGVGVVVSPLIALMQDQVDALTQLGVRAAFLNSSLTPEQARSVEQAMQTGALDLVYVAPERLLTERFLSLLERIPVALFAIDEAHCVSQWGHDFRPEYIQLDLLHARWPQVPRIALTATADVPTRNEIVTRLRLEQAGQFVSSFDRPNIRYRIVEKANPRQQLLAFLRREHPGDAGIVYCLSRKRVEETAVYLQGQGFAALPYHAGLSAQTRRDHQARFLREEGVIMVATIAFGMGIDKPDVRFVAHLDLPKSLESYYQETGRAGRDGQPANAWMAYGLSDVVMLRRFIEDSDADEHFKRIELHKLDGMLGYCETTECRRQVMLNYFSESLPAPCGNCDTCLEPVETWDGTVAAQKALSCIYRTGQRFGSAYLTEVLLGKSSERIRRVGHDQVSTFGIGRELSADQWRSVYRQLVAAGLAAVDMEGHGALRLTETSRPLLRGERGIRLRRDPDRQKATRAARAPVAAVPTDPEAAALWQVLRDHRRELALAQNVPAYVIFADSTLREILAYRPRSLAELSRISGVGQAKLERFGAGFLQVLADHESQHGRPSGLPPLPTAGLGKAPPHPGRVWESGLSDTVQETLDLFRTGLTPEAIAARRSVKLDTIYTHLSRCIEEGELDAREVVRLDDEIVRRIEFAFDQLPERSIMALKPVFDAFDGQYDYGLLRCVRAGMHASPRAEAV
ncbi:DNA helicase RecQ [Thiobaca trueperi]|uniref:DNA helicase RecQ n=1 Tax=Thiobaca trueperi TaxID=127458 RepID=A0A4R3N206_9GAMM|nr:DNA helicase RecQ [Thiobaca trueperi]TCT23100.1 ATP-dependent DNA helicase RecQ [Thiobaca trueperi]